MWNSIYRTFWKCQVPWGEQTCGFLVELGVALGAVAGRSPTGTRLWVRTTALAVATGNGTRTRHSELQAHTSTWADTWASEPVRARCQAAGAGGAGCRGLGTLLPLRAGLQLPQGAAWKAQCPGQRAESETRNSSSSFTTAAPRGSGRLGHRPRLPSTSAPQVGDHRCVVWTPHAALTLLSPQRTLGRAFLPARWLEWLSLGGGLRERAL